MNRCCVQNTSSSSASDFVDRVSYWRQKIQIKRIFVLNLILRLIAIGRYLFFWWIVKGDREIVITDTVKW